MKKKSTEQSPDPRLIFPLFHKWRREQQEPAPITWSDESGFEGAEPIESDYE